MTVASPVLDRLDRRIIGILQHDGRISWRELAERVHLAPSSVADRVRRLEQAGVIRGYGARIDPRSLGRDVRAVVDVALPPGTDPAQFEATLAERDEVAGEMPADLLALYEKLRTQHGGVGAAKLFRGRCEGCHMELNPTDIGRIREAPSDAVVRCEECRRILVRASDSGL